MGVKEATAHLTLNHFVYASRVYRLEMVEDQNIPTAMTNGKQIRYNPEFVDSLTLPQQAGLLAHEALHVILLHMFRMQGKDSKKANVAGDIVANLILLDDGIELPDGAIIESQYKGWSMEEVYADLPDDAGEGNGPDEDPGACGGFEEPEASDGSGQPSPADIEDAELDATIDNVAAANVAKGAGKLPAGIREIIKEMLKPKINPYELLREFVRVASKTDWTWARPNKKYVSQGVYLPSLHKETLGEVVIGLDKSGSIDYELVQRFLGWCQSILDDARPERLRVLQFDTEVQKDDEYVPGEIIDMNVMGGGGTAFQPVFDYIEKKGYEPMCCVMLTDMDSGDTPKDPGYPVLWVSYGRDAKAPFGEIVKMRK